MNGKMLRKAAHNNSRCRCNCCYSDWNRSGQAKRAQRTVEKREWRKEAERG